MRKKTNESAQLFVTVGRIEVPASSTLSKTSRYSVEVVYGHLRHKTQRKDPGTRHKKVVWDSAVSFPLVLRAPIVGFTLLVHRAKPKKKERSGRAIGAVHFPLSALMVGSPTRKWCKVKDADGVDTGIKLKLVLRLEHNLAAAVAAEDNPLNRKGLIGLQQAAALDVAQDGGIDVPDDDDLDEVLSRPAVSNILSYRQELSLVPDASYSRTPGQVLLALLNFQSVQAVAIIFGAPVLGPFVWAVITVWGVAYFFVWLLACCGIDATQLQCGGCLSLCRRKSGRGWGGDRDDDDDTYGAYGVYGSTRYSIQESDDEDEDDDGDDDGDMPHVLYSEQQEEARLRDDTTDDDDDSNYDTDYDDDDDDYDDDDYDGADNLDADTLDADSFESASGIETKTFRWQQPLQFLDESPTMTMYWQKYGLITTFVGWWILPVPAMAIISLITFAAKEGDVGASLTEVMTPLAMYVVAVVIVLALINHHYFVYILGKNKSDKLLQTYHEKLAYLQRSLSTRHTGRRQFDPYLETPSSELSSYEEEEEDSSYDEEEERGDERSFEWSEAARTGLTRNQLKTLLKSEQQNVTNDTVAFRLFTQIKAVADYTHRRTFRLSVVAIAFVLAAIQAFLPGVFRVITADAQYRNSSSTAFAGGDQSTDQMLVAFAIYSAFVVPFFGLALLLTNIGHYFEHVSRMKVFNRITTSSSPFVVSVPDARKIKRWQLVIDSQRNLQLWLKAKEFLSMQHGELVQNALTPLAGSVLVFFGLVFVFTVFRILVITSTLDELAVVSMYCTVWLTISFFMFLTAGIALNDVAEAQRDFLHMRQLVVQTRKLDAADPRAQSSLSRLVQLIAEHTTWMANAPPETLAGVPLTALVRNKLLGLVGTSLTFTLARLLNLS